jgi:uncharacterized protein YceK
MRNAVVAVAVVALLSGCGGSSHPSTSTTVAPKKTHAQIVAAARAKAAAAAEAHRLAVAAAKARAQGYTVNKGDPAGYKFLTKLVHRHCTEFGNHGCWQVEIVTFKRCPFFEMDINEMRRGAVVETYRDNQLDVAPDTPIRGEFDATEDNVTLGTPVFTCNANG